MVNIRPLGFIAGLCLIALALPACKGIPSQGERQARDSLRSVTDAYRPQDKRPSLPTLQADAGLSNFLAFAILSQPQVEAAY